MSIKDLESDIKRNSVDLVAMADMPVAVRAYLCDTLWPCLQNFVEHMSEQSDAIDELAEDAADILQEETAKELAAPIVIGISLADELRKRIGKPKTPQDVKVMKLVAEFRRRADAALATIEEITLPEETDEPEDAEAPGPANGNGAPAGAAGGEPEGEGDDVDDDDPDDDDLDPEDQEDADAAE